MNTNYNEEIPVFEIAYDRDNEKDGLFTISLVDQPAILEKWTTLNGEKYNLDFKVTDDEQHIITGPALIPYMRIIRNDEQLGLHYIFFSEQTIKDMVTDYFRNGRLSSFNIMHNKNEKLNPESMFLIESWFVGAKMDKSRENGYNVPKGSWMVSHKVDDMDLWNSKIKTGDLQGFSVEVRSGYQLHLMREKFCPITDEMVRIAKLRKFLMESDLQKFISGLNGKAVVEYWNKQCKCTKCRELKAMGYCLNGILPEFGQWKKTHKVIDVNQK